MSKFAGFSEAARVYAQHAAVVEEMQAAFRRSVNEFLDSLQSEIRELVGSECFHEAQTPNARYWWLAEDDQVKDKHPYLWIDSRLTKTALGELRLTANAPSTFQDQRVHLVNIAKQPEFAAYCKSGVGGPYSLFTVILQYGEKDPVDYSAKLIADILSAMRDVISPAK